MHLWILWRYVCVQCPHLFGSGTLRKVYFRCFSLCHVYFLLSPSPNCIPGDSLLKSGKEISNYRNSHNERTEKMLTMESLILKCPSPIRIYCIVKFVLCLSAVLGCHDSSRIIALVTGLNVNAFCGLDALWCTQCPDIRGICIVCDLHAEIYPHLKRNENLSHIVSFLVLFLYHIIAIAIVLLPQEWPFYRHTVFDIKQSTYADWPTNLWFLV